MGESQNYQCNNECFSTDLQKLYDTHKILRETYHKYENYW